MYIIKRKLWDSDITLFYYFVLFLMSILRLSICLNKVLIKWSKGICNLYKICVKFMCMYFVYDTCNIQKHNQILNLKSIVLNFKKKVYLVIFNPKKPCRAQKPFDLAGLRNSRLVDF